MMQKDAIYIAMRRSSRKGAKRYERAYNSLTRGRLASMWCHGGVVCKAKLYHITAREGPVETDDFTPQKWDLYLLPKYFIERFMRLWRWVKEHWVGYDYFSQLAFWVPCRVSDSKRLYCFELQAMLMGISTKTWSTPERILAAVCVEWQADGALP